MTGIIKFMNDCCGSACSIPGDLRCLEMSAESINAATGWDLTRDDLFQVVSA